MLKKIPKASGGDHGNQHTGGKNATQDNFGKSKSDAVKGLGFTPKQTAQFQQMADHEQQVIADAVLDAEVRIGELMEKVPKAQGMRTDIKPNDNTVGKYETIKEAGLTPKQVERFQWMTGPEQKSAGQNKTSVKLAKTGNYQFGCQK